MTQIAGFGLNPFNFWAAKPSPSPVQKFEAYFKDMFDWISAADLRTPPPSLTDRLISWFQALRSMITGYKAPVESQTLKATYRIFTIAKRMTMVVAAATILSTVCYGLGAGFQEVGRVLLTATAESIIGMGARASGHAFSFLGTGISTISSVLYYGVTDPLLKFCLFSPELFSTLGNTFMTSFFNPAIQLGQYCAAMVGDGLLACATFLGSRILSPVFGVISDFADSIFKQGISAIFGAISLENIGNASWATLTCIPASASFLWTHGSSLAYYAVTIIIPAAWETIIKS